MLVNLPVLVAVLVAVRCETDQLHRHWSVSSAGNHAMNFPALAKLVEFSKHDSDWLKIASHTSSYVIKLKQNDKLQSDMKFVKTCYDSTYKVASLHICRQVLR